MYEQLDQLAVLGLALALDLLFGEPPKAIHPTVWMGKYIGFLEKGGDGLRHKRLFGIFISLSTIALFSIPVYFGLGLIQERILKIIASSLLLKTTFAIRDMEEHANAVRLALERGRLREARAKVSKICGRDTSELDAPHIASAAVESVAESTVDGIVSPIFYFMLFGVPGAFAYRVINTLDSMLGYRTPRLKDLGMFPAKLDTIANYVLARLTAFLMVTASWLLRRDHRSALRICLKDHSKTESLNSGWPMSATAGALGVSLEKLGHYSLGSNDLPNPEHVRESLRLMKFTSLQFIALCVAFSLLVQ